MTKIDQLGQGLATTKPAAQDGPAACRFCSPPFSVGQIGVPWAGHGSGTGFVGTARRGFFGLGQDVSAKLPSYNQPQPAMDSMDGSELGNSNALSGKHGKHSPFFYGCFPVKTSLSVLDGHPVVGIPTQNIQKESKRVQKSPDPP